MRREYIVFRIIVSDTARTMSNPQMKALRGLKLPNENESLHSKLFFSHFSTPKNGIAFKVQKLLWRIQTYLHLKHYRQDLWSQLKY